MVGTLLRMNVVATSPAAFPLVTSDMLVLKMGVAIEDKFLKERESIQMLSPMLRLRFYPAISEPDIPLGSMHVRSPL
jgi:hypothetical protein